MNNCSIINAGGISFQDKGSYREIYSSHTLQIRSNGDTNLLDGKWNIGGQLDMNNHSIISAGGISFQLLDDGYREIYGSGALKIHSGGGGTNLLYGRWEIQESVLDAADAVISDQKKKHEIESLSTSYSTLFDNLTPVTYKYNDGTSNRKHTGFIAQQVNQALEVADISTQDFAGLVVDDKDNWYLRYDEFIALNTWQIQKLKSRVAELEKEIAALKIK